MVEAAVVGRVSDTCESQALILRELFMSFARGRSTRRDFLSGGTAALLAAASPASLAAHGFNLDAIERSRVLKLANGYLKAEPVTITSARSPRSAGGTHDFFSESDSWWPDPAHPGGPYIQQDGFTNPDRFNAHRDAMVRMGLIVPALAAAWKLTRQRVYAEQAASHVRAWFLDPTTRMNPNLEYAQAIFGVSKGRGAGILDTVHLVEPARAVSLLMETDVFTLQEHVGLVNWFADYLKWLTTSKNGIDEREEKNIHGSCWVLQVAEFAHLTAHAELQQYCRERFRTVLIPSQVATDGKLPLELARKKPYSDSLFDLDVLATIAQVLSTPRDNLFTFEAPGGRGLRKAVAFMEPYIADKKLWPYAYDMQHFEEMPVRQPSLLFAGMAYDEPRYLALWRSLNPDPTVPEIVRNFPVRQPVLWV
jgi:hypothetical protein